MGAIAAAIDARGAARVASDEVEIIRGAHDVAQTARSAAARSLAIARADLLMVCEGAVDPATESAVRVATELLARATRALEAERSRASAIRAQASALRGN